MLLHGFGEDGKVWQQQVDFLQPHFQVIVPDIPGSGQSAFINDANIETYAEIIKLILDTELKKPALNGTEEIAVIGHSMGGYITLALVEKWPDYFNVFGLFHSSAFADSDEKKANRRKAIEFINTKGAAAFLKMSTPSLFTKLFAQKHAGKINQLIEEGKKFSNEALVQYYAAMIERPDKTEVLRNFNKPVLFLIGEQDTAIPLQSSLQQCYLPNQSHVTILKQSAHMGMWEEAEKANNILLDFLHNIF